MHLMIIIDWNRSTLQEIGGKFASGVDVEPENAKILSRWHDPGAKKAWIVVDTPDAAAVQDWVTAWADYMDVTMHAVIDDAEVGAILQKRLK